MASLLSSHPATCKVQAPPQAFKAFATSSHMQCAQGCPSHSLTPFNEDLRQNHKPAPPARARLTRQWPASSMRRSPRLGTGRPGNGNLRPGHKPVPPARAPHLRLTRQGPGSTRQRSPRLGTGRPGSGRDPPGHTLVPQGSSGDATSSGWSWRPRPTCQVGCCACGRLGHRPSALDQAWIEALRVVRVGGLLRRGRAI